MNNSIYLGCNLFYMKSEEQRLKLDTEKLKPNPINLQVYGNEGTDYRLINSIEEKGQLEPLVVIEDKEVPGDYVIISGHRRWTALKTLGKKADCRVVSFEDDELEMKEAIVEFNKYRKKKPSQIVNEANLLRSIYAERAKKRQTDALKQNADVLNSTQREGIKKDAGKTRDKVADAVGMGWKKLNQLVEIKEKADNGDEDAEVLMNKLDNEELTVNGAATYLELIEAAKSVAPEKDYALKLLDSVHKQKMTSNHAIKQLNTLRKKISDRTEYVNEIRIDEIDKNEISKNSGCRNPDGTYNILFADFSDSSLLLEDYMNMGIPITYPAVLCLLTTIPFLKESLDIMGWWNFKYKSMCIWERKIKTSNSYFQGVHELLLIGTIWDSPQADYIFPSIISEKKGHECVHKMIQKMFPNQRYIDLFPKENHEGWSNWILKDEKELRKIKELEKFNQVFDNLDKNESIKMIITSKKKPDGTVDVFEEWY